MTRQEALTALNILTALPIGRGTGINPTVLARVLLLRADLQRIAIDTEASRRTILEGAKMGYEDFDTRLMAYQKDPESDTAFAEILSEVDNRFAPAYRVLMNEEADLRRPLLTSENLADLCEAIALDGEAVEVGGMSVTPLELLTGLAAMLVAD